jgi:hypothetical protein
MLSRKRGYKVNSISTYLGLVVDGKKFINIIANRLLDNKRPNQNQIILLIIERRYKSAESMLSQKRGYKVYSSSTYLNIERRYKSAESKKGIQCEFHFYISRTCC